MLKYIIFSSIDRQISLKIEKLIKVINLWTISKEENSCEIICERVKVELILIAGTISIILLMILVE